MGDATLEIADRVDTHAGALGELLPRQQRRLARAAQPPTQLWKWMIGLHVLRLASSARLRRACTRHDAVLSCERCVARGCVSSHGPSSGLAVLFYNPLSAASISDFVEFLTVRSQ